MVWAVKFDRRAEKKFAKLDRQTQKRIKDFIDKKLVKDPIQYSKLMIGDNRFYRSRIGDYRIIFELKDKELLIILIDLGHRREIYK